MSQANLPMLKLMAVDGDDLTIFAAHLQDAVTQAVRFDFSPGTKTFAVELNRFVWEGASSKSWWPFTKKQYQRRNTVLHFARVEKLETRNINRDSNDPLVLLTINFMPNSAEQNDPSGTVELQFAGNQAVRLHVECIEAQLTDLGGAWQAVARPQHGL
jgi:hypothetical protein